MIIKVKGWIFQPSTFYVYRQIRNKLDGKFRNATTQTIKTNAQQQFAEMAGFGLNLKLVLYLQSQCLTESLGFLNPQCSCETLCAIFERQKPERK